MPGTLENISPETLFNAKFRRSRGGNLWQERGEWTITIFQFADGYRFCISGIEGRTFSETMRTEWAAMRGAFDVASELEGVAA
jgi:hypothetical protein